MHLIEANPQYAFVKRPDGSETTVSIKDLAPRGEVREVGESDGGTQEESVPLHTETEHNTTIPQVLQGFNPDDNSEVAPPDVLDTSLMESPPEIRKSNRLRMPTERLITEVTKDSDFYSL